MTILTNKQIHSQGCPIPDCEGFLEPSLAGKDGYGVALVGEALGEHEAIQSKAFVGPAGFKLTRLLEWAGLDRQRFDIWNAVWCRPPANYLDGASYESDAVNFHKQFWFPLVSRVRVIVPMGNVALSAFTGRKGILTNRGYVESGPGSTHLVPTVHPSFIQRGQSKYSAAFIHDIQKAVELARDGLPARRVAYELDPSPGDAYQWAKSYVRLLGEFGTTTFGESSLRESLSAGFPLSFDIECPYKPEDESESSDNIDTDSGWFHIGDSKPTIWRIGFSYSPGSGLSVPFVPAYFPTIRLLLESAGPKVVWNEGFDVPILRRAGFPVRGVIHDGMVMWHILHSDLPKSLGFVATFTCPYQPRWKHLSMQTPAYYNVVDADVELTSFLVIKAELERTGLWKVYQRDVLDLNPILISMTEKGMPVDVGVRLEKAIELDKRQREVLFKLEALTPLESRKVEHVYSRPPSDTRGLRNRPAVICERVCGTCGVVRPRKDHFKVFVKKHNPCGGGSVTTCDRAGVEWYRLQEFTPSRNQLIRHHEFLGRPLPTKWDKKSKSKKVSFDEKAMKILIKKYPLDSLYSHVLTYRELDKVAGTYIGRPCV